MNKVETYRTKEDAFLIVIIRFPEKKTNLVFLIDPWKVGIKEFETHKGSLRQLKNELGLPSIKLHSIDQKNAAKLIRNGLEISNHLGINLPPRSEKWIEKLGIKELAHHGTVYKCFNCEEGDLTEDEITEITEIAKREIKSDIVGTTKEEQFFYICQNCHDKMHKQHTKPTS